MYPATVRSCPEKDSEEKYDTDVGCKYRLSVMQKSHHCFDLFRILMYFASNYKYYNYYIIISMGVCFLIF